MSDFRTITDSFLASPQIDLAQVSEAKDLGVTLIVNNRPEDESPDQTPGSAIEAAALDAGLGYRAIPITHAGFSQAQVDAMIEALGQADGKVLAYCRSGTRSTLLWSLAQARLGRDPDAIARDAARGGYDISPVRAIMDALKPDG